MAKTRIYRAETSVLFFALILLCSSHLLARVSEPPSARADSDGRQEAAPQIFNKYSYTDGSRRPDLTYEENRVIKGHKGERTVLLFRLSLYGKAAANMPLLVQVHEWGGNFQREEDVAACESNQYEFVMLYFQYDPSTGNEDDWWFGSHWGGLCRMWAHDAVIGIVKEAIQTKLVGNHLPGVTIDKNRVYMFGHSIGGTGAWQLGLRHPEIFAAVHAHSGFARFTPPVGPFQQQFDEYIVGTAAQKIKIKGADDKSYLAREYSSLYWWLQKIYGVKKDVPFISFTAGTQDATVPMASGGDLMLPILDEQKRGFFFHRHDGEHSDNCFVQLNWMWNFRLNQSFLAFTNRRGYGITPKQTVKVWDWEGCVKGGINDLYKFGWDPSSIVDKATHYEVRILGKGTADVTPRRLQKFVVTPKRAYRYWLDKKSGAGKKITADANGLLTVPAVSGNHKLIIEPAAR
jgi:esterase/lipase superfamily enzyme